MAIFVLLNLVLGGQYMLGLVATREPQPVARRLLRIIRCTSLLVVATEEPNRAAANISEGAPRFELIECTSDRRVLDERPTTTALLPSARRLHSRGVIRVRSYRS